jgi:FlaA1/EpsC-like NDP-sugar epimerase
LVAAISHPVIMTSRLIYRCVEELVFWLKRQDGVGTEAERVLLYGAGGRAQLFLKDNAIKNAKSPDGRRILGFLDDEPSLHFQWVYGFLVLGGIKDLPHLIERHKVSCVILVTELLPENRAAVQEVTTRTGVKLIEWQLTEHELPPLSSEPAQTKL